MDSGPFATETKYLYFVTSHRWQFSRGQIYVEVPPSFNHLTPIHIDSTGFMSNNNILGTCGTTPSPPLPPSPISSQLTLLLYDLKLMLKPQWVLWWMLGDFEVGEVWQTAWGECFKGLWGGSFPNAVSAQRWHGERLPEVTRVPLTTPLDFLLTFVAVVRNKIMALDITPTSVQTVVLANSTIKETLGRSFVCPC